MHYRFANNVITGANRTEESPNAMSALCSKIECILRSEEVKVVEMAMSLVPAFVWRFLRTAGPEMLRVMNRPAEIEETH